MFNYILAVILLFIPLYPKFPLVGISGTFVSVRLEDFIIALLAAIWVIYRLIRRDYSIPGIQRAMILYWFAGFVAVFSGVFVLKSTDLSQGFLHLFRRMEYMILFFMAFDFLKNLGSLRFLIKVFIVMSLCVALYGLGQQLLGLPVISTTNSEFAKGLALTLGPDARINSTFAGHYDLAAFTVFPLLLILGLVANSKVRFKLGLLAIGSLIYWTLLLSASRVTFAAFFITAGLFVIFLRRFLWLLPLVILAIGSILVSPQLLGRYQNLFREHLFSLVPVAYAQVPADAQTADALKPVAEDRSFSIRINAEWPRAMRAFLKNPVLGTGFSSVGLAVDNDYLRALSESGILGFFAFGLIFLRFYKTSLPYLLSPPESLAHVFITAMTLGLSGLMLNAMFIDVFEASKIALITWTLLGLTEKTKYLLSSNS